MQNSPSPTASAPPCKLSYRQRYRAQAAIHVGRLDLGRVRTYTYPPSASSNINSSREAVRAPLYCTAYADGGPWYIPTADAYPQGGYEPAAAFVDPAAEDILKAGITKVLT